MLNSIKRSKKEKEHDFSYSNKTLTMGSIPDTQTGRKDNDAKRVSCALSESHLLYLRPS